MHHRTITRWVGRSFGLLLAAAVVAGAVVGFLRWRESARDDDTAAAVDDEAPSVAEVSLRDLSESYDADGSLVFEAAVDVTAPTSGTVLALASPGDLPAPGDVIARVDDVAVVWLDGDLPAWRSLTIGDEGADVEQLEAALVALGFDDFDVTVDDEYTWATSQMVEAWQESIGVEPTGDVELGTVVFSAGNTRIASTAVAVGDTVDGDVVVSVGTDDRVVTFDAAPADAVHLAVGSSVTVSLPDGGDTSATVTSIDEGADAWSLTASVDGAVELPERDTLEVGVSWDVTVAADALTVPSS
ncbi:MAG: peptidoglycan-binding protein, partial [Ilumatobacter sp.]|nr:peptidoglycan-binding protein [Ilumatobacter sp.]